MILANGGMWPSARPGTAATTVVTAVVLLLGQTGDHHSVDAATCCVNSTSGEPFNSSSFSLPSPCVCLTDNTLITGQNLTRGESALYHWVLETSSSELITLVPRGNVTFKVGCEEPHIVDPQRFCWKVGGSTILQRGQSATVKTSRRRIFCSVIP